MLDHFHEDRIFLFIYDNVRYYIFLLCIGFILMLYIKFMGYLDL